MKVQLTEHDGCFGLDLEAENMEEAAALVRLGMNRKEGIQSFYADAKQNDEFSANLVFGKSKRASSLIPKRK